MNVRHTPRRVGVYAVFPTMELVLWNPRPSPGVPPPSGHMPRPTVSMRAPPAGRFNLHPRAPPPLSLRAWASSATARRRSGSPASHTTSRCPAVLQRAATVCCRRNSTSGGASSFPNRFGPASVTHMCGSACSSAGEARASRGRRREEFPGAGGRNRRRHPPSVGRGKIRVMLDALT
jgi:hypothetical protein